MTKLGYKKKKYKNDYYYYFREWETFFLTFTTGHILTLVYSLGWELNPLEDWQGIVENMIERVWRIDKAGVVEKLATEFSDV